MILNFILSNNLVGTVVYTILPCLKNHVNAVTIHEVTNPRNEVIDLTDKEESDLFDFIEIAHYKMVIQPGLGM